MKKSLKNLELKKQKISNLTLNKIKGEGLASGYECGNTARTGPDTRPICMRH